jgi:hypothetical protein
MHSKQELIDRAVNKDWVVRFVAVRDLASGWPGDLAVRDYLLNRADKDDDAEIREAAVEALGEGWPGDKRVQDFLIDRVMWGKNPSVREAAVKALGAGWSDDPVVRDYLLNRAANDKHAGALDALAANCPDQGASPAIAVDSLDEDTPAAPPTPSAASGSVRADAAVAAVPLCVIALASFLLGVALGYVFGLEQK